MQYSNPINCVTWYVDRMVMSLDSLCLPLYVVLPAFLQNMASEGFVSNLIVLQRLPFPETCALCKSYTFLKQYIVVCSKTSIYFSMTNNFT